MNQMMIRALEAAKERQKATNWAELGRLLGESDQTITNWKSRGIPRGKLLTIARAIGCSVEWIEMGEPDESLPALTATEPADHVQIPVMNAAGSMGLGRPMPETESVVDVLKLTKSWVNENLRSITSPRNLAALSAYGDSMSPTFADGDILLVDRGVTSIQLDAVYVLQLNDELFIKRIQRRITDGAVIIMSDNPLYQPVTVENGERANLRVLGRIVWAWNGRKL